MKIALFAAVALLVATLSQPALADESGFLKSIGGALVRQGHRDHKDWFLAGERDLQIRK
jgi:hypothetical protein